MGNKQSKWEIKPVECLAPVLASNGKQIDLSKYTDELFRINDDYFSVQGGTGLCVRHAVAKALLEHWRYRLGRRHPMNLEKLIAYLITSIQKGSKGVKVTDFASMKGTIADQSLQKVYEMEIYLKEEPDFGNIMVLNLAKVFPNRGYKDPSYHAVFQQHFQVEYGWFYKGPIWDDEYRPIHNSWGDYEKIISMSDAKNGIQ